MVQSSVFIRVSALLSPLVLAGAFGCGGGDSESCERPGVDCDVTLPLPESGFQMTVGPVPVPQGEERLQCYWLKVPETTNVNRIEIAYNVGSHHLDIFTVPYSMPDGDFDCSRPEEWGAWPSEIAKGLDPESPLPQMVVGFQNDSVDWPLPEGVSFKLEKGQQLMIQSHFANVNTQNTPTQRLWDVINFHAGADTQNIAETLFDEDTQIHIPAHETAEITRICEFPQEVNIIGMFTHYHSRGTDYKVYSYDTETQQQGEMIYENPTWDDPPWYTTDNWGGAPIKTSAIKMVAQYFNFEDRDIDWGFYVQDNEHMETYAMFYPRLDLDPECVCHREGEAVPAECGN